MIDELCGCGFKDSCYVHCDHDLEACPGKPYKGSDLVSLDNQSQDEPVKSATPDIDTQIEEIAKMPFLGCEIQDLVDAIKTLLIQSKIDELEKQADYISGFRFRNLPSRDTGRFGTKDFKVEAQLLIEAKQRIARILTDRISKLKEELERHE